MTNQEQYQKWQQKLSQEVQLIEYLEDEYRTTPDDEVPQTGYRSVMPDNIKQAIQRAKQRARYAFRMQAYYWARTWTLPQDPKTGKPLLDHAFPAVQDGYIIPATPSMYQDD